MHHHRAGNLQQKNKGHKRGQHDSKRKLDRRFHGRVDQSRPGKGAHRESVKSLSRYAFKEHGSAEWVAAVAAPVPTRYVWCNSLAQGGKAKRFNAAKQKLRARKAEILMARRMGTLAVHATTPCMLRRVGLVPGSAANCARADGGEGVPKVVVLLPYADNTDCIAVRNALFGQAQTIGTTDMATVGARAGSFGSLQSVHLSCECVLVGRPWATRSQRRLQPTSNA